MEVDAAHSSAAVHGRLHAVAGKEDTHEEHSHMRCLRAASVTGRLQRRTGRQAVVMSRMQLATKHSSGFLFFRKPSDPARNYLVNVLLGA